MAGMNSFGDPNFYLQQPSFLDTLMGTNYGQQMLQSILQAPQLPGGMTSASGQPLSTQMGSPGTLMGGMQSPQSLGFPPFQIGLPSASLNQGTGMPAQQGMPSPADQAYFSGIPGWTAKFAPPPISFGSTAQNSPLAPGSQQSIQWPSVPSNPNWNPSDPDKVHAAQWGPGSVQPGATFATTSATLPSSIPPGVAKWQDLIQKVAQQVGIKPSQIAAIVQHESGGNPNALSAPTPWGKAEGLMQVMPFNAKPGDNLMDPLTNLTRGAELLKTDLNKWGNQNSMAAAYYGAIDANGNPNNASDGSGITGNQFVQQYNTLQKQMEPFDKLVGAVSQYVPQLQQALASARTFVGNPYVWGGADPQTGFDCSGLTQWVFGQHGVNLPRTAQTQYNVTQKVNPDQTIPGDLIFFQGTYPSSDAITHVGLYVGNGQMLSASQNGIGYQSLTDPYWSSHFAGVGRVPLGGQ